MNVNRRSFLKGLSVAASVAAGGCASFNTPVAHRRKPGEKLNMGFIGCGGKGWGDWLAFHKHGENTVALCDVDTREFERVLKQIKDGNQRERELKNMMKVYPKLEKLLPELRRAEIFVKR